MDMDWLLNTAKDLHTEKVNEFEEMIKRLRKYNKDLRYELTRQIRVTTNTNTPDIVDDEEQDLPSYSTNSTSDNCMGPSNGFKNALVMDNIFGYLDVIQLKKCRLICKDWNQKTSSILSQRNNGNGLVVNLQLQEDDVERSRKIHSIVKTAPENWFRNIKLDLGDSRWGGDAYKRVFQDFGNRLKVINFTSSTLNIEALRGILLDWCPNLEEFAFGEPDIRFEADRDLKISLPLKLTSISFNVCNFNRSVLFANVAEVVFTIIKNSPNLKKLESFGLSTTTTKHIFSKLQNYPQIMNKIEEMFLRNSSFVTKHLEDPLKVLSNIQFECSLKKLFLANIKPGQSIDLSRLLNTTKDSLEKLIVIADTGPQSYLPASVVEPNLKLKQMSCLREFRYHVHRQGLMNSIDILLKMPNLKIFVLGFEIQYSTCCEDFFIDNMFSKCRKLMEIPHPNLLELYLFGYFQKPKSTFEVIERGFPNLNKLVVGLCHRKQQTYEYFSLFFEGMSKLKKLNKLFLDLSSFKYGSIEWYKIDRISSYFKKLPNLMHLAMRGTKLDLNEAFFSKVPKLQRLTLIEVKMDPLEVTELQQLLDERGVFLDLKDSFQFPEDGIKWDLEF